MDFKEKSISIDPTLKNKSYQYSTKLLEEVIKKNGLIKPLQENYSWFLKYGIEEQLFYHPIKLPNNLGRIEFTKVSVSKPVIGGYNEIEKPIYPQMARMQNLDYVGRIYVSVAVRKPDDTLYHFDKSIRLGSIPIMLGCEYCYLHDKSDEEILELGECIADPLGYFIVGGSEIYIINRQLLKYNHPFVYYNKRIETDQCIYTAYYPKGTSIIYIRADNMNRLFMGFETMTKISKNIITNYQKLFPIYVIYRMLGMKSRDEITAEIMSYVNADHRKKCMIYLLPSIIQDEQIGDYKQFIAKHQDIREMQVDEKINHLINHNIFPNLNVEGDVRYKIHAMSMCVSLFLEYQAGFKQPDDRDSWANKQLLTSTYEMNNIFSQLMNIVIPNIEKNFETLKDTLSADYDSIFSHLNGFIRNQKIGETLRNIFSSRNWVVKKNYRQQSQKVKKDVAILLERKSFLDIYSQVMRISNPASRKIRMGEPRMLTPSQIGYVCAVETPDNERVGLITELTTVAYTTYPVNHQILKSILLPHVREVEEIGYPVKLVINGCPIGFCNEDKITEILIIKRRSDIYRYLEFAKTKDNYLFVFTNASRLTRPMLIVDPDGKLVIQKKNLWNADLNTLLSSGCMEYIGTFEFEKRYNYVAMSMTDMELKKNAYNTVLKKYREFMSQHPKLTAEEDKIKDNYLKDLKSLYEKTKFTHCEISPNVIFGAVASTIPLPNHQAGPRSVFTCKMSTQALGRYHSNFEQRFDTTSKVLAFPTRPLFETQTSKIIRASDSPFGESVIVAITAYGGWNQEDAFIFNGGSIERGLFSMIKYSTYVTILETNHRQFTEIIRKPNIKPNDPEFEKYSSIQDNGLPAIGSAVEEGDYIIGKIRIYNVTKEEENRSIAVKFGDKGIVDRIVDSVNENREKVIKVRIKKYKKPEVGDKFASRYAQKGTIGKIIPTEEMPRTENGTIPDIIINPHSIPSRMTVGKIIEIISSKAGVLRGERMDASAFSHVDIDSLKETLRQYGFSEDGKEILYDPKTGKSLDVPILIGPCYYLALKHLVGEKIQHRGIIGKIVQKTGQPEGGREIRGGIRFGEMERDALLSHGAMSCLQDRLMLSSDQYTTAFCQNCGNIAISNQDFDLNTSGFRCNYCGISGKFVKITIPKVFKYALNIISAAGINLKLLIKQDKSEIKEAVVDEDILPENEEEEEKEESEEENLNEFGEEVEEEENEDNEEDII